MGPDQDLTRVSATHPSDFLARRCQTSQTRSCRHFSSPIASTPDSHWISAIGLVGFRGHSVNANKPPIITSAPGIHSIGVESATPVTITRPLARKRIRRGTGLTRRPLQIRQSTLKRTVTIANASQDQGGETLAHQLCPSTTLESAETPRATVRNRYTNLEGSGKMVSSTPGVSAGFTR